MPRDLDLVDQMTLTGAKKDIAAILSSIDDSTAIDVCRDIVIDQITATIEKFPLLKQKELLAILVDNLLTKWANNERKAP